MKSPNTNNNNMARPNALRSTVIPDLIGNPAPEKFLLDSRLRLPAMLPDARSAIGMQAGGNDRKEGLPIGGINHTRQAGITLVELVVAAFILIASLTALLISFSRVKHNAETAHRELNALHVARTEIEQFRSTDYSSIAGYAATNLSDPFFVPLGGQKQCVVVSNNGYRTISLTVRWRSTVGPIISQTFNTIICNTN